MICLIAVRSLHNVVQWGKKGSPENRLLSLFNGLKRTVRIPYTQTVHFSKWAASRTITRQTTIQDVPTTSWKHRNPLPNPLHTHTHTLQVLLLVFRPVRKIAKSVMSVRSSVWSNSAPTGWIFMKFDIWIFFENRENSGFIQIEQD